MQDNPAWTPQDFLDQVIVPALTAIGEFSVARALLVLATALSESRLRATHQAGGGPALGYCQMEPVTHNWLFSAFLGVTSRQYILDGLRTLTPGSPFAGDPAALAAWPQYGAAMGAVKYLSVRAPLPDMDDPPAAAAYYVKYYNGGGKATVDRVLPFFEQISRLRVQA